MLAKSAEKSNENYVLANIALASDKLGDKETAKSIARKLAGFAQPSSEGIFWKSQKTPFYGWGKTADIETTALILQAILPYAQEKEFDSLLARGLSYLIKNKDGYGVWYSTQTTVNVLDTLTLIQSRTQGNAKNEKTAIFINGKKVTELMLDEKDLANPFILDVSPYLEANENTIEIKSVNNSSLTMAQMVATHFSDWKDAKLNSSYFSLKTSYDKTIAKIGEEITCAVQIERKNNVYGMILAEIGIPPGADVDRNSLEKARTASNLSNYDILPDKIGIC
ncbi:MAG: hypothetical protein HC846_10930 [Blastocatellia bacterium]|nr:hypothetical protein [Blastocatellia bacterium]